MTNSAKRYSTRAASIAVGTVALGLLIWAIIAFAGGTVTVNPSTVPIGTKVTAKLTGGFTNASSYYAEYWGPTADNAADDAAHRMRCYSTVRKNTLATFSTSYTTNAGTNHLGSNWTARYLYNPNYNSPQFVVFDSPFISYAKNASIPFKFHLVDRLGRLVTANHLTDLSITLKNNGTTVSATWTFASGYYTYTYAGSNSNSNMSLLVTGAAGNRWLATGTTSGSKETKDRGYSNTKSATLLCRIGNPTSGNAYRITPAGGHATFATNTTLNTSGEKRSSMIYVPGTPSTYRYTYQFDVFDNGASTGGTPAAVTSGVTLTTATAQGAGGNAAAYNNLSTTNGIHYANGHWYVRFDLPGPDKYGIYISVTKGTSPTLFQVVNLAATSPAFTVAVPKSPPANPSSFVATPGDRKVSFGWTNPPNPSGGTLKGIIICRKLDNNPFDAPADGASYNVGGVVQASPGSSGASTVVYKLDPASAGATGQTWSDGDPCPGSLTTGGSYYYKAFAYDTQYSYSSGVSSASNNPAVPYDATLPGVVTAVTTGTGAYNGVAPLDKANLITWTPSADCDYHGVIIYANTAGWPTSSTGADGSRLLLNTPNAYKSGGNESYKDTPLNNGTQVYYSVWTRDDDGNVNTTPVHFGPMAPRDTEAPGQVSGSAAPAITAPSVIAHDAFTATLQWYAPADNGYDATSGNATAYEIRYVGTDDPVNHPFPITDANWSKAFPTGGAAAPSPASKGTVQTYKIEGLSPNQHY